MNGPRDAVNGDRSPGTEVEPKVYDAELIDHSVAGALDRSAGRHTHRESQWRAFRDAVVTLARWMWHSDQVIQARSIAGYRARKAPRDAVRLVWFVVRGNWRWLVKLWQWTTYADLRADARTARLSGDTEARRVAQELIRSDAKARWAKVGIALRRLVITMRIVAPVVVVLWAVDAWMDRTAMWTWLSTVYTVLDAAGTVLAALAMTLAYTLPVVWAVAAAFEGRDKTPGAGWLIHPDRDDADTWIDERMISKALAHLGIAPLNRFFKDGGQLVYTVPARRDGDGTYAQVRLPLGVTADMVAERRSRLAANLGRASLETWPTKGEEDGILDLWVADKGVLGGGAGGWPLLHDGQVDLFEGVPLGLSQRGLLVNAPMVGANWLIGGRPGQGKTSAMRTLLLGAALDPTAELWVFVMGESPDFDPFTPRMARYRMGMDDSVAEAAVQGLVDLLAEMERRGRVLGEQPGRPPKVSRNLADKRCLGLHPLVCAIDECHELFQHPTYGKKACELAVRLIKRGRKYGITLILATQSPTKDSIPREITRNISCGVAFSVADQVANDGLLGSGKYRAGIRATDLRMKTDRGTCVAVGVTDNVFELLRTYYIPFEDGIDDLTPVIARAMAYLDEAGRAVESITPLEIEAAPVDHLGDITDAMHGEPRVRTQVVLARLVDINPAEYENWSFTDLTAALAEHCVEPRKSHGVMVVRAHDLAAALARRNDHERGHDPNGVGDPGGELSGSRGVLPAPSPPPTPRPDLHKPHPGRQPAAPDERPGNPRQRAATPPAGISLPAPDNARENPTGGADDG